MTKKKYRERFSCWFFGKGSDTPDAGRIGGHFGVSVAGSLAREVIPDMAERVFGTNQGFSCWFFGKGSDTGETAGNLLIMKRFSCWFFGKGSDTPVPAKYVSAYDSFSCWFFGKGSDTHGQGVEREDPLVSVAGSLAREVIHNHHGIGKDSRKFQLLVLWQGK